MLNRSQNNSTPTFNLKKLSRYNTRNKETAKKLVIVNSNEPIAYVLCRGFFFTKLSVAFGNSDNEKIALCFLQSWQI